jgi:hypothetical protein
MHILLGYGYYPGTTGVYFERALAHEHQVTYAGTAWYDRPGYPPTVDLSRVVAGLASQPDLFLYIDSGNAFYAPIGLEKLPFPTAAYLIDAWPPFVAHRRNTFTLRLARLFDYVFVAHLGAVVLFTQWREGLPVDWLPLACDPEIHGDQHLERTYDVGFVGQYNPATYPERARVLQLLSERYAMNDFRRPYYLTELARIYSQSKIGFNMSVNDILTMRFFEVLASGAMLVTQASSRNGQDQLAGLKEGEHFITFDGQADLVQKVDYYLSHPDERQRIAQAGQAVAVALHTYACRARQLLVRIAEDGGHQKAPLRGWPAERQARAYMETHSLMRMIDATMSASFGKLTGTRKWQARAAQLYYAATALLRRIKHEWK